MSDSPKRALFVASQKGGPGKTTFTRGLLDYYRQNALRCAGYDADGRVGQLIQYYGTRDATGALELEQDPLAGVGYFDIRAEGERDTLLNVLDTDTDRLLFDLPGGVVHELSKVMDMDSQPKTLLKEYQRSGYRVTVVVVMIPVMASVRTVQEAITTFGDQVDYIAVKNLAFGDSEDFVLFDGYEINGERRGGKGKAALEQHQGVVMEMPRLSPRTYALLDLYNLTFAEAIDDTRLTRADRSRVYQWRESFYRNLESAADFLAIDKAKVKKKDRQDTGEQAAVAPA